MGITIIKQGIADTVQDKGRFGYRDIGMNTGGVMDQFSASVANYLAGNFNNEAVIEMHFPAPVILFRQPALIALAGADMEAMINGERIPPFHPLLVNKDSILHFNRIIKGARAYLAVQGGLDIKPWFNSCSANIMAGPVGILGRVLQTGDEIGLNSGERYASLLEKKEFVVLPWRAGIEWENKSSSSIYVLPGKEWDELTSGNKEVFLKNEFSITHQSNRMGYRLRGQPLESRNGGELVSTAVSFGTVQLLPDGQLIILMADHQTTGGYPRIAHIISAHHGTLSQCKAGEGIRFAMISHAEAENLFQNQSQYLQQLKYACILKRQEFFPEQFL